jgi:hypothetical protein
MEKLGNMTSSCIVPSLKTFMSNRIGKTHKAKRVQHDV